MVQSSWLPKVFCINKASFNSTSQHPQISWQATPATMRATSTNINYQLSTIVLQLIFSIVITNFSVGREHLSNSLILDYEMQKFNISFWQLYGSGARSNTLRKNMGSFNRIRSRSAGLGYFLQFSSDFHGEILITSAFWRPAEIWLSRSVQF